LGKNSTSPGKKSGSGASKVTRPGGFLSIMKREQAVIRPSLGMEDRKSGLE
jgi:hypothetical protein